jgi:hypothetical protein
MLGHSVTSASTTKQPERRNPVYPAHRLLVEDNIRLLFLRPVPFDDPIHCQFKQVHPDEGYSTKPSHMFGGATVTLLP